MWDIWCPLADSRLANFLVDCRLLVKLLLRTILEILLWIDGLPDLFSSSKDSPLLSFLNHRETEDCWTPSLEATCLDVKPDVIKPTAFQRRPNSGAPPLPDIAFQSQVYVKWVVNIWVFNEKCTIKMTKTVFVLQYKKFLYRIQGCILNHKTIRQVFLWCKTFVTPYIYIYICISHSYGVSFLTIKKS